MAYNGSGTFQRIYSWATDLLNSVKITASRMDTEMDGFATGLSTCVTKDGQTTTTAMIPFAAGLKVSDGLVATPSITFTGDTDSGWYRIGANNIGIGVNGAKVLDIQAAGLGVTGTLTSTGALNATTGTFSGAGSYVGTVTAGGGLISLSGVIVGGTVTGATTGSFSGAVTVGGGLISLSGVAVGGTLTGATSGAFSTSVTVGTTLGVTGVTTLSAGLIGTTGVFSGTVTTTGVIITTASPMLASTATMTNFAGGGAGTLTNAPTAGNPTKWVAISDNGTTRYIPTWT